MTPEKIYVYKNNPSHDSNWLLQPRGNDYIEYIRSDIVEQRINDAYERGRRNAQSDYDSGYEEA